MLGQIKRSVQQSIQAWKKWKGLVVHCPTMKIIRRKHVNTCMKSVDCGTVNITYSNYVNTLPFWIKPLALWTRLENNVSIGKQNLTSFPWKRLPLIWWLPSSTKCRILSLEEKKIKLKLYIYDVDHIIEKQLYKSNLNKLENKWKKK